MVFYRVYVHFNFLKPEIFNYLMFLKNTSRINNKGKPETKSIRIWKILISFLKLDGKKIYKILRNNSPILILMILKVYQMMILKFITELKYI